MTYTNEIVPSITGHAYRGMECETLFIFESSKKGGKTHQNLKEYLPQEIAVDPRNPNI
jgi:hypothetical protein